MASTPPLLVISPHLDDAALSCGWRLAAHPGSVVATVCTASPGRTTPLTGWDRECGFGSAAEAMAARREEDLCFARRIGAAAIWLGALDAQYGHDPRGDEPLVLAMLELFEAHPRHALLAPLGLVHPDHLRSHRCALAAWQGLDDGRGLRLYEDVPYRAVAGALDARRMSLREQGLALRAPSSLRGEAESKRALLDTYPSQWRRLAREGLKVRRTSFAPERVWQLSASA